MVLVGSMVTTRTWSFSLHQGVRLGSSGAVSLWASKPETRTCSQYVHGLEHWHTCSYARWRRVRIHPAHQAGSTHHLRRARVEAKSLPTTWPPKAWLGDHVGVYAKQQHRARDVRSAAVPKIGAININVNDGYVEGVDESPPRT